MPAGWTPLTQSSPTRRSWTSSECDFRRPLFDSRDGVAASVSAHRAGGDDRPAARKSGAGPAFRGVPTDGNEGAAAVADHAEIPRPFEICFRHRISPVTVVGGTKRTL